MNLCEPIFSNDPESVAVRSRGDDTTYAELATQVASFGGALVARGVEPGDRVAIVAANNWYFIVSCLAALHVGAIAVPLSSRTPSIEMERQLKSVGVTALLLGPGGTRRATELSGELLASMSLIVTPDPSLLEGSLDMDSVVHLDEALASNPATQIECGSDDVAVLLFTSGTAGEPKAAMLTHGNLMANHAQLEAHPDSHLGSDDVVAAVLPFSHIFGLNVMLFWPLSMGSMVIPVERFDPSEMIEIIRDNGVTTLSGAPPMWAALLDLPGVPATAFATVKRAASGASALPSRIFEGMRDVYGLVLSEGYGLTETAPVVSSSQGASPRPGSVGVPLPGVEMRLVDVEGQDALLGDVGEVWVRGPNVFAGYWQDEAATNRVLTEDGWLKTGDLGVLSEDSHLSLVDRAKDLIIVSGFNVYPAEVEEVLIEHELVEACAVIGVPHPHSGEAVTAQVILRAGAAVEEDELVEFCRMRIASYKCPTKIRFVDRLPVAESGKMVRRLLASDDS